MTYQFVTLTAMITFASSSLAATACPEPPRAATDLNLTRYYSDPAKSQVDVAKRDDLRRQTETQRTFLRTVSRNADKAWQARTQADRDTAARCAISWLDAWADAGAYLGHMATKQAEYQRNWDSAGLALVYLKIRKWASPAQHDRIGRWLQAMVRASYSALSAPGRTRNNHWYWHGLAQAGTALATGNAQAWKRATTIFGDAVDTIAANGTLPLELSRGARALHYHVFSVMPLVVMAELADSRGEDWYRRKSGALNRLVAVTVGGLVQPALFDRLAGVNQERPVDPRAGWAFLYAVRYPKARIPPQLTRKRRHRLLGGDVRVLLAAIRAR
ncbi:MAG: alginate lyase family protein [Pseudomonadota bacterium]